MRQETQKLVLTEAVRKIAFIFEHGQLFTYD